MAQPNNDDWRTRDVRAFTSSIPLFNALSAAGLASLGRLWDYWEEDKSLLTAGGIRSTLNALAVNSFLDYCDTHPEIPKLANLTRIETEETSPPATDKGKFTMASKEKPATTSNKTTQRTELPENVQKLLAQYEQVFGEVSHFIDLIGRQEAEIAEKQQVVYATKEKYESAKSDLAEARDSRDGTKHALFVFLKPGPVKILPLFDRMEKADEKKHGAHSDEWRKEPVSAMRLSLIATSVLTAAEIIFVGQLQDRVQARPADWWDQIDGLTAPMGLAIGDRLNDFIKERTA
jgi:hypothetical protein